MKKIDPKEITDNPIKLIGDDWMLVTAGIPGSFNTMTASWGGVGHLWNRPVVFVFVRHERYTYGFTEREEGFTLSFFDPKFRKELSLLGTKSGRDSDKISEAGLTPIPASNGSVTFSQARLILECKKLYVSDLEEAKFLDRSILGKFYDAAHGGLHRVYIAEITAAYQR